MESMEHKGENKIDNSWFNNSLVVGAYPFTNTFGFELGYDIIINVSDEYYDDVADRLSDEFEIKRSFWFPMSEKSYDIGLNSIYGALVTLYNAEINDKHVYLHCHAGVNRSQIVRAAFHYMMYGYHYEGNDNRFINRLVRACHNGYLPPKEQTENFLTLLKKYLIHFKGKPLGGLIDEIRIETLK